MSRPSTANVNNGYLSPEGNSHSTRGRSSSVTPSERSSISAISRITIVENNPELASYHGPETHDSYKVTTKVTAPKYSWFEHLLGLFCINVAERKEPIMQVVEREHVQSMEPEIIETDSDSWSPWILPVYVLSSRKDTDKQPVPKEGKCTIDTGNHQGNIVSRDFVLNVLQLSEANFRPLTKEEKKGATGITDHKLIPEAAIYLTWYHKKSTRVFHDMRFLVSPYQHYDLIIGARSIREHKLLDVPNLMARNGDGHLNKITVVDNLDFPPPNPVRAALDNDWYTCDQQVNNHKGQIARGLRAHDDVTQLKQEQVEWEQRRTAAQQARDEYKADIDMRHFQKAPTGKSFISNTDPASHSTGIDKSETGDQHNKRHFWQRKPRGRDS